MSKVLFVVLVAITCSMTILSGCVSRKSGTSIENNVSHSDGTHSSTRQAVYNGKGPLIAACTTGIVADAVRAIGGKRVLVEGLMGPGVDPHLYKATPGDVRLLEKADIIFYNGLHLEGKMQETLQHMGKRKPVCAVADSVPKGRLRSLGGAGGTFDPHIWFDVSLWTEGVSGVRDAFIQFDPEYKQNYQRNAADYIRKLEALHLEVKTAIATIPAERRVLVTAHDAFSYFGKAYDIEVIGLQGISTVSDYGLGDVKKLVDTLVDRKIKAVFLESSVPRRSIEAVVQGSRARNHNVDVGGTLYSDALGAANGPAGTFIEMVKTNVTTITEALR